LQNSRSRPFCNRFETHRGSLEANTLDTAELHFKHLTRILGAGFPIGDLKLADLQGYADRRSREKAPEGKLSTKGSYRWVLILASHVHRGGLRRSL
jgi:hypothetical protein